MRRLAIAFLGMIFMGATASAADLPRKAPIVAPVPYLYNWTGFYIGANIGYGWSSVSDSGTSVGDINGVIGGGQIGYNWQWSQWLVGVEADIQASGQSRSESAFVPTVGTVTADLDLPWFATLRGRLGYVAGPWLIYATGGVAWTNVKASLSAPGGSISDDTTKAGWTLGGGVEWMFVPRWSAKLEYLYIDTGSTSVTLFNQTFDARVRNNIVRLGVNYHF